MVAKDIFIANLSLVQKYKRVSGSVVECGVWKGGMIASMAKVLGKSRKYYLFDSFEGLPAAKAVDGKAAITWQSDKKSRLYFDNCKAEEKYAKEAMKKSGVTDYVITKGWFSTSLKKIKFEHNIAVLRLDADWYDSTMLCLSVLYDHVIPNGLIIIDDYYAWDGCSRAVHQFLAKKNDAARLFETKEGVSYIIKP